MISIIVAIAEDNGIGYMNDLLWHLPEDLKRFKKITMGKTVVMGKKTWISLPRKPLPGRKNVIITDYPEDRFENSIAAFSIDDAIEKCKGDEEIIIMGGGSIYRQFMPLADRLYITHVHKTAPADIFFPEIDPEQWESVEKEDHPEATDNPVPYTYVIYQRKKGKTL
jgi:dihydrofolate reductase